MPKYDPIKKPKIADIVIKLKELTVEESIVVRDYLSKRISYLVNNKVHLEKRIEDLGLSNRAIFVLKKRELHTVQDVLRFKPENLLPTAGLGEKTYNEICRVFRGKVEVPFTR